MREIIREGGPEAKEAARLGIFVMNHVMRPFLAKWHRETEIKPFNSDSRAIFRAELREMQVSMKGYAESLLELMDLDTDLSIYSQET